MTNDRPPRRPPPPPPLSQYRPQREHPAGAAVRGPMPPRRRAPPPPEPSHWLRNSLIALVALAVVAGGGAFALSLVFPETLVRDRLVAEVKARTGRDLTIAGPMTFSAVPTAHVTLQDVTLAAPEGVNAPALATIPSLEVSVSLWPLLWREVVVERVALKDPTFTFAVDDAGRDNWTMKRSAALRDLTRLAQAEAPVANDAAPPNVGEQRTANVSVNELLVENGSVKFADARKGADRELTGLAATFVVRSLTAPATGRGSFVYRGETIEFDLEVGAVQPLLAKSSSRLNVKLTAQPFTATYDGSIFPAAGEAEGALDLRATSVARTAVWLGANLPEKAELGSLTMKGQLRSGGKLHALSNIEVDLNGIRAGGHLTVDAAPARPMLRGELTIADLDINRLIAPAAQQPAAAPSAQPTPPGSEPSIENLIENGPPSDNGTRVQGYVARGGWSEEPIRLTALTAADADLKLALGSVAYGDLKAGASRVALALNESVLKATIEDAALYGGHGRGFVVLDGRVADMPHVGLNLTLDNVSVRPLLQDAAKLEWIDGQGNASVAVAGSGPHQRALVQSLAGKADLKVAKGAVVGIDVNRMAENLADGNFKGLKSQPGDQTAFSALSASWHVENGVARNDDLRLTSDIVTVSGSGSVLLPDRTLDYTIRPRLADSGDGDGKGLSGIEVPVRMSGSWEKPTYKADVGGAVEEIGRRLKGKDAGEIVDELIGKDSKGESKAKKLLDKLFR